MDTLYKKGYGGIHSKQNATKGYNLKKILPGDTIYKKRYEVIQYIKTATNGYTL